MLLISQPRADLNIWRGFTILRLYVGSDHENLGSGADRELRHSSGKSVAPMYPHSDDDRRWLGWESKYGKYERRFASHHVRHSISGGSGDNGGPNTLGRRAAAR